ncbi:MAG: hypothetical protein ACR2Q4_04410 [Geminicoccaceae bacterium]
MARILGLPALGLSALCLLAACEDQVTIEKANSFHSDVRAVATQARGEGDILLLISGAESIGSPDAVLNTVQAAMEGRPGSVNPSYTLTEQLAGQTTSSVRVVLNGPKAMTGPDICRGDNAGSSSDDETRAALAFCQGERALSSIKGRASKVSGPDDPKFSELIQSAARELFPAPERE